MNVYESMPTAQLDEAIRQLEEQAAQIKARGTRQALARAD